MFVIGGMGGEACGACAEEIEFLLKLGGAFGGGEVEYACDV